MIGQEHILENFKQLVDEDNFPRFAIICGPKGSGKKLIVEEVSKLLGANLVTVSPKVDDVRAMISSAYKMHIKTLYLIADADNMSPAAKNAILKVTEEAPNNAYFIMTLLDINNTLATIRSRSHTYYTDLYSREELEEYFNLIGYDKDKLDRVMSVCEVPGEIDTLMSFNVDELFAFVNQVIDNIAEVSIANSFKIGSNIAFKETDEDKYDLRIFLKIFMSLCLQRMLDSNSSNDIHKYSIAIKFTSKLLQSLRFASLNKQFAFDKWILSIRGEW